MKKKLSIPSLKETYKYNDKLPFGGYITYHGVNSFFGKDAVITSDNSSYYQATGVWDSEVENEPRSLYFILSEKFDPDQEELKSLLSYVRRGNDLFVSSNLFDTKFLDTLGVQSNPNHWLELLKEQWGEMTQTKVEIALGKHLPDIPFHAYYYPFLAHFISTTEKTNYEILGKNENGKDNFIVLFLGSGRIYLHFAPRALSNYFLLSNGNLKYLEYLLNYADNKPAIVYWDNYLSNPDRARDNDPNFSRLNVLMAHKALKWAFFIALFGVVVFLLSSFVVKQREIPVLKPSENASVDFAKTVARLYYVHKNNKNIATKLITYFYENVKRKYLLTRSENTEQFALRLVGKRNWTLAQIEELLGTIERIQHEDEVSDEELMDFNELLEKFYKTK